MKRIGLALVLVSVTVGSAIVAGGCGKNDPGNMGIPDGFVSNNCSTVADCSPTSCQTAKCNPVTHMCQYTDKVCDPIDDCNVGMCDPTTTGGDCTPMPANEGVACTTMNSVAGTCQSGTCTPVPSCAPMGVDFLDYAECDSGGLSLTYSNNTIMSFGNAASTLNSYGCAPTENGPEIAFVLSHDSAAGDEDITIKLTPLNDDDTAASADDKDLDLIILEDSCTGGAKCMNPMLAGGSGYQGVTAGTANERVTFHATAGKDYYVVVDGKDMNQTREFVIEVEACGKCQPTDTTRLSCNMSMAISANTVNGAANLTDYTCGPTGSTVAVSAPGKEIPFYFRTTDPAARNVTASITAPTADYRMMVLEDTFWGQCDPMSCDATVSGPAANSITFKADPGFDFNRYWVVVDTPNTTDAGFGLQLTCAPFCQDFYDLECGGGAGTETNVYADGTTIGGPTQVAKWGPTTGCDGLTGLVGPENTVGFTTDSATGGMYKVVLIGKTAGKNLSLTIIDGGTTAAGGACDPTAACVVDVAATGTVGAVSLTGTHTTNGTTQAAGVTFTATKGEQYYIVVDGTDVAGAEYSLQVIGSGGGAGCP